MSLFYEATTMKPTNPFGNIAVELDRAVEKKASKDHSRSAPPGSS